MWGGVGVQLENECTQKNSSQVCTLSTELDTASGIIIIIIIIIITITITIILVIKEKKKRLGCSGGRFKGGGSTAASERFRRPPDEARVP